MTDISGQMHKLSIEMREFAEVIRRTSNPYHEELIHACNLFSQYLDHELNEIGIQLRLRDYDSEIRNASVHMNNLCQLITPHPPGHLPSPGWKQQLQTYCDQTQTLKSLAA